MSLASYYTKTLTMALGAASFAVACSPDPGPVPGSGGGGGRGGSAGLGGLAGTGARGGSAGSAGAGASGGSAGKAGAGGGSAGNAADAAPKPPLYSLRVDVPANASTVRGSVSVRGTAPGFVNVEVWDTTHQQPPLAQTTPGQDGAFSMTVDTTRLGSGATTWTVHGWDTPAGQTPAQHAFVTLTLTLDNRNESDAGVPGRSAFVMGAENKDGSHAQFEAAVQCDTNINQITTGWCSDWTNWEKTGCGVFAEVSEFYQADARHAVELSLAPWPTHLAGPSFGACARGDYNAYYQNLARSMLALGMRHVLIRLAYEWDGNWFPWGTGLHETGSVSNRGNGGTALEYAACFRQFDNSIQAAARATSGAVYFRTVMNPIHDTCGTKQSQLQQVIDAAGGKRANGGSIDFLGVDFYDYPKRNNLDSRMRACIDFGKRNGIPLSFPEWGVGGDSRAQPAVDDAGAIYIQDMYDYFRDPNNGILYASYFNCVAPACAGNHSLIPPNNPKSSAAFSRLFGNGKLGCGANARALLEQL
jgi:hypothetical protein